MQEKNRYFVMVLYPDEDLSHSFCLNKLKTNGYLYLAIDHDKDTYTAEETNDTSKVGTLKKKHTHVYLRLKNPRYIEPLAKELGITPNYIEVCRNSKQAMLYMVHDGYTDKYQYDITDCYGTLTFELAKLTCPTDEGSRVLQLLDLLDTMPTPCTYKQFLLACCNNSLYSEFRRLGSGVRILISEHNCPGGYFL